MREPHGGNPPGSNPTIYRCLKSPGPQVWSQLASPIPVVSFWSETNPSQDTERPRSRANSKSRTNGSAPAPA